MSRRNGPAPSRLQYRLQRLMLRPVVRRALRVGPVYLAVALFVGFFATSPTARGSVAALFGNARAAVVERAEFRVTDAQVLGASPALEALVEGIALAQLPASSLQLDLKALKTRIESIPRVQEASVRIGARGLLTVDLSEREPSFVWRVDKRLHLLDASGITLGQIQRRSDRPRLPLIVGAGADRALDEAIALLQAAEPVATRVRALQRVGSRRWNVVLDRDQVLMLPEESPAAAFRRIMALNQESDILTRDVVTVDFRDARRPTLRMGPFAADEMRRLQALQRGETE